MVTWPSNLPQMGDILDLSAEADETVQRYEMSWGPPIQRRKFSAYYEKFELPMLMTDTQLQTLYDFYDNTLSNGSADFTWVHPITRNSATVRLFQRFTYNHKRGSLKMWNVTLFLEVKS